MFARGNGDAHGAESAGDGERAAGNYDHGAIYNRRLSI